MNRTDVSIIGVGCSPFAEHWTRSAEDLLAEAVLEAYADAGIEDPRRQIDARGTPRSISNVERSESDALISRIKIPLRKSRPPSRQPSILFSAAIADSSA